MMCDVNHGDLEGWLTNVIVGIKNVSMSTSCVCDIPGAMSLMAFSTVILFTIVEFLDFVGIIKFILNPFWKIAITLIILPMVV